MSRRNYVWPFECYGNTRFKRKCPNGYEISYSSNFPITGIFRMIKKTNAYKKTGKGYAIFDNAFDIRNRRLLFYISITVFVKKKYMQTAVDRNNEFMWWIK